MAVRRIGPKGRGKQNQRNYARRVRYAGARKQASGKNSAPTSSTLNRSRIDMPRVYMLIYRAIVGSR